MILNVLVYREHFNGSFDNCNCGKQTVIVCPLCRFDAVQLPVCGGRLPVV